MVEGEATEEIMDLAHHAEGEIGIEKIGIFQVCRQVSGNNPGKLVDHSRKYQAGRIQLFVNHTRLQASA